MSTLGMFARYPEPGKTKTRLAAAIGDQAAAELYTCFVQDLATRMATLSDRLWIAATGDEPVTRDWFAALLNREAGKVDDVLIQPNGDLGARIAWFFEESQRRHPGPAILIGTDSPDLPASRIRRAFDVLEHDQADVVLVPATDGGFVSIGMSCSPGSLFDGIRWSSPWTLLDMMQAVTAAGQRLELLPPWYDVDHVESLGTLAVLQQCPGRTESAACPATADYLRRWTIGQVQG